MSKIAKRTHEPPPASQRRVKTFIRQPQPAQQRTFRFFR